ncbi:MAG: HNH endonuclease [Opitutales bacterium]|nr:HNH endonuclease [Opitutales bacterium]
MKYSKPSSRRSRAIPKPEKHFAYVIRGYNENGYKTFYHPVKATWVLEHRWIIEQVIGGKIFPGYVVHHIDHNKLNNHPSNLKLMRESDHLKLHGFIGRSSRQHRPSVRGFNTHQYSRKYRSAAAFE